MYNNINSSCPNSPLPAADSQEQANRPLIRVIQNTRVQISIITGRVARYRRFRPQTHSVLAVIRQGRGDQRRLHLPEHFILETDSLSDTELDMVSRPLADPISNFFLGFQTYRNQGMSHFVDNTEQRFLRNFIANPDLAYALFPTTSEAQEDSEFPVVTERTIDYFNDNYILRNVHRTVTRMALSIFGFTLVERHIEPFPSFENTQYQWLDPANGNRQRAILRQIIESLHLLGNGEVARSLCDEVLTLLQRNNLTSAHSVFLDLRNSIQHSPIQAQALPAEPLLATSEASQADDSQNQSSTLTETAIDRTEQCQTSSLEDLDALADVKPSCSTTEICFEAQISPQRPFIQKYEHYFLKATELKKRIDQCFIEINDPLSSIAKRQALAEEIQLILSFLQELVADLDTICDETETLLVSSVSEELNELAEQLRLLLTDVFNTLMSIQGYLQGQ